MSLCMHSKNIEELKNTHKTPANNTTPPLEDFSHLVFSTTSFTPKLFEFRIGIQHFSRRVDDALGVTLDLATSGVFLICCITIGNVPIDRHICVDIFVSGIYETHGATDSVFLKKMRTCGQCWGYTRKKNTW